MESQDYVRPQTLEDALAFLAEHDETKILAGGTDLLVLLRRSQQPAAHILDIKAIPALHRLDYSPQTGAVIGAGVTVNQILEAPFIQARYPALAQAAGLLASYQIRNRATLAGNLCNASPGADLTPPLLVYDAKIHIANRQREYVVNICEFFTGVKKTVLQPGDLVTGISLPDTPTGDKSVFLKQTRLKGHDLGIVGLAARWTTGKKVLLAMSAVAPTPIRLAQLEEMLNAEPLTPERIAWAAESVGQFISPISDVRSSAQYRLHIARVLVKRALLMLLGQGGNQNV